MSWTVLTFFWRILADKTARLCMVDSKAEARKVDHRRCRAIRNVISTIQK